jgi:flagellar hook-basal body complex protein FliE
MDIKTSLAATAYARAKPATTPDARPEGTIVEQAAREFAQVLQQGEDTAKAAMLGRADPHALVQALAQTERAVETAVVLRDKVVEAYQEILRMPV